MTFLFGMLSIVLLVFPTLMIAKGSMPSGPVLLSMAVGIMTTLFFLHLLRKLERRRSAEVRIGEEGIRVQDPGSRRDFPWTAVRLIESPCIIFDMLSSDHEPSKDLIGWRCVTLTLDERVAILACVPTEHEAREFVDTLPSRLRDRLEASSDPIRCGGTRDSFMGRLASKRIW